MKRAITKPRPGHADLVGGMKYNHRDLRNVLERSSARETAARVAVGALCKQLLKQLGIDVYSRVIEIGGIKDEGIYNIDTIIENIDKNDVRVIDDSIARAIRDKIDSAKKREILSAVSSKSLLTICQSESVVMSTMIES